MPEEKKRSMKSNTRLFFEDAKTCVLQYEAVGSPTVAPGDTPEVPRLYTTTAVV